MYLERPSEFVSDRIVASCAVVCEGEFLLLQRAAHDSHAHLWGLPTGSICEGEAPYQAARRELTEETGIIVSDSQLYYCGRRFVRHDLNCFEFHQYVTRVSEKPTIVLNPEEHQQFLWVAMRELTAMKLVEDVDQCLAMVASRIWKK